MKILLHVENYYTCFSVRIEGYLAQAELNLMGEVWYFSRLFVPPKLRGQKIASNLVKEVLSWADKRNQTILLEINSYGDLIYEHLCDFYLRYGFKWDCNRNIYYYGDLEKVNSFLCNSQTV